MDVIHRPTPPESSPTRLNPNAPIFIPMSSYQTVEDFSDQWWDLVRSSPWFRDYWLQDCFLDPQSQSDLDDLVLPEFDAFFDPHLHKQEKEMGEEEEEEEEEEERRREKEVITVGALKWNRLDRRGVEATRNLEKAPKIVKSVKVSPRTIHQPR